MKETCFDFALLIPCFNNTEGLLKSLQSVEYASQSFLVLVVDDGSQQPVIKEAIEKELAKNISITILRSPQNEGITKALNRGLNWLQEHTTTKYIARLDCGDICLPARFDTQVRFLDMHPEIGLLGTWCRFIDEADEKKTFIYKSPATHKKIMKDMHFKNSFMHATVMLRSNVLTKSGLYPEDYEYVEDYALFWKIATISQVAILPEVLTICYVNRKGISYRNKRKQLLARWKVVKTFGERKTWIFASLLKLLLLLIIPKGLILFFKRLRSSASLFNI